MFEEIGESGIKRKILETKERAIETFRKASIREYSIFEDFDLYTLNNFAEYPLYLLGPDNYKKRPKNWKEWLNIGPCKYQVRIKEKTL